MIPDPGTDTLVNNNHTPVPREYEVETILGDKQVFNGFR